jgi:hypothetical protein
MAEFTEILRAIEQGDRLAADQLVPLVYDELRKLVAPSRRRDVPCIKTMPTAAPANRRLANDSRPLFLTGAQRATRRRNCCLST